ncbi:c-type cytochrome [Algibacillus agarilyticus]|uniref:c-type cytochrome n=1 Tax=Algibacillus agarilyticus TaxID=2234133 RepID=UPI000DD01D12|nr:cytochrome c [Algibacillus agarilyticus]
MNNRKRSLRAASATLALVTLIFASITQAKSQRSLAGLNMIKERQAAFVLIQSNFKFLGDVARGRVDATTEKIEVHASRLAYFSKLLNESFHKVSNLGAPHTKTTERAWSESQEFNSMMSDFQRNTENLALLASSDNFDHKSFRRATAQVGKDCKACHRQYKAR